MIHWMKKVLAVVPAGITRAFGVGILPVILALIVFQVTALTGQQKLSAEAIGVLGQSAPLEAAAEDETKQTGIALETMALTEPAAAAAPAEPGALPQVTPVAREWIDPEDDNAIAVTLRMGSVTREVIVRRGADVEDVLAMVGIEMQDGYEVSPGLGETVHDGDVVTYGSIKSREYTVEEVVPYEEVEKLSPLIEDGKTMVVQTGKDGLRRATYQEKLVAGQVVERTVVESEWIEPMIEQHTITGADVAVSPLEFDVQLDENGVPEDYAAVLTNQVATGYSAREGSWGASGEKTTPGHVAVDPREIPYGTKLYITSRDGSFVYGYAVATDTGIGLLNDVVDVDLFYDTYDESCLNGRKIVDIYILE